MKRLGGILAATVLTAAGAVVTALPAQAAPTYITVCNSLDGFTRITATGAGYLANGQCTLAALYNGNNNVRVNTDPDGWSHSYKIKPDGGSYGPCHTDSDNHSSDPPNVAKVYYKNYDHGNCTN